MAKEQKERDDLKNGVIATVKGENEGENEVVGESSLLDGVEIDGKIEKEEKKLTFVSSLTFADMILEYFHTEKKQPEGESNLAGLTGSTVSSIQPPPFSPLFSSPSSPSPSSTSLDVKGSKYGVELALLRREGAYVPSHFLFLLLLRLDSILINLSFNCTLLLILKLIFISLLLINITVNTNIFNTNINTNTNTNTNINTNTYINTNTNNTSNYSTILLLLLHYNSGT